MKNTFKMMLVAFAMFAFSANAGAMTLNLNKVAKSLIVDQDGNGGVKVKKSCDKDGDKKECNKDGKKECSKDGKKKSCCKKDGKEADKKECSKDAKKKSCSKDGEHKAE